MGDMGEVFNAMKEAGKEKREKNRESSPEILKAKGIEFESKNLGAHLIVKHNDIIADFWPGTGKYIVRKGRSGRGVFNLIRQLGE